jgi:hypothetical protein
MASEKTSKTGKIIPHFLSLFACSLLYVNVRGEM